MDVREVLTNIESEVQRACTYIILHGGVWCELSETSNCEYYQNDVKPHERTGRINIQLFSQFRIFP